ncbi:MAG: hypothetical protein DRP75_04290, partial [Candidatus Omnitrophota bacterium]
GLEEIIGREKIKEIITPTLIPNTKETEDGVKYIQLDSALASALLNFNAFFIRSKDPRVKELLERCKVDKVLRIVNFSEADRTKVFTPVKFASDYWLQKETDYYRLNTRIWMLEDRKKGQIPPVIDLQGKDEKDKFYEDVQNLIDNLGNTSLRGLESLLIRGRVRLRNARLRGKVEIWSKYEGVFDLNKAEELKPLVQDGRLTLSNLRIRIDNQGRVSVEEIHTAHLSSFPLPPNSPYYEKEITKDEKKSIEKIISSLKTIQVKVNLGDELGEMVVYVDRDLFRETYLTEEALGYLLQSALAREREINPEINVYLPSFLSRLSSQPLTIAFLNNSPHLFEDHLPNSFIGINRAIQKVKDRRTFDLLLQIGLLHELRHEIMQRADEEFEQKQLDADISLLNLLLEKKGLPLYFFVSSLRQAGWNEENSEFIREISKYLSSPEEISKLCDKAIEGGKREEVEKAIEGLEALDARAKGYAIEYLRSLWLEEKNPDVREEIIEIAGEIGGEQAIRFLIEVLEDRDIYEAIKWLRKIGGPLAEFYADLAQGNIRNVAKKENLQNLLLALNHSAVEVRDSAAKALSLILDERADEKTIAALIGALGEEGISKIIFALCQALSKIDSSARIYGRISSSSPQFFIRIKGKEFPIFFEEAILRSLNFELLANLYPFLPPEARKHICLIEEQEKALIEIPVTRFSKLKEMVEDTSRRLVKRIEEIETKKEIRIMIDEKGRIIPAGDISREVISLNRPEPTEFFAFLLPFSPKQIDTLLKQISMLIRKARERAKEVFSSKEAKNKIWHGKGIFRKRGRVKVGIIGTGGIGQASAYFLDRALRDKVEIVAFCDKYPEKAEALRESLGRRSIKIFSDTQWKEFIETCDFIIESAHPEVSAEILPYIIEKGKSILILSTGGLARDQRRELLNRAKETGSYVFIPSGALPKGIGEAILKVGKIEKIIVHTRKRGERSIERADAQEMNRRHPTKTNIDISLALMAGIPFEDVDVVFEQAPEYTTNRHQVTLIGKKGRITVVADNTPSTSNPHTSQLAIDSTLYSLSVILGDTPIGHILKLDGNENALAVCYGKESKQEKHRVINFLSSKLFKLLLLSIPAFFLLSLSTVVPAAALEGTYSNLATSSLILPLLSPNLIIGAGLVIGILSGVSYLSSYLKHSRKAERITGRIPFFIKENKIIRYLAHLVPVLDIFTLRVLHTFFFRYWSEPFNRYLLHPDREEIEKIARGENLTSLSLSPIQQQLEKAMARLSLREDVFSKCALFALILLSGAQGLFQQRLIIAVAGAVIHASLLALFPALVGIHLFTIPLQIIHLSPLHISVGSVLSAYFLVSILSFPQEYKRIRQRDSQASVIEICRFILTSPRFWLSNIVGVPPMLLVSAEIEATLKYSHLLPLLGQYIGSFAHWVETTVYGANGEESIGRRALTFVESKVGISLEGATYKALGGQMLTEREEGKEQTNGRISLLDKLLQIIPVASAKQTPVPTLSVEPTSAGGEKRIEVEFEEDGVIKRAKVDPEKILDYPGEGIWNLAYNDIAIKVNGTTKYVDRGDLCEVETKPTPSPSPPVSVYDPNRDDWATYRDPNTGLKPSFNIKEWKEELGFAPDYVSTYDGALQAISLYSHGDKATADKIITSYEGLFNSFSPPHLLDVTYDLHLKPVVSAQMSRSSGDNLWIGIAAAQSEHPNFAQNLLSQIKKERLVELDIDGDGETDGLFLLGDEIEG